jgi:hypothetical protein
MSACLVQGPVIDVPESLKLLMLALEHVSNDMRIAIFESLSSIVLMEKALPYEQARPPRNETTRSRLTGC